MSPLPLTFRIRSSWPFISILLLLCVLVFQLMSIRHNPSRNEFTSLLEGDVLTYAKGLLYYIPVEFITVCVILTVLVLYKKWLHLDSLYPTAANLLKYELIFLPAILGSILVVCPTTNAVRYALLYVDQYDWNSYYPNFFFTWRMYFKYLLSVLLFSYAFLNANLMLDYIDWHQASRPADVDDTEEPIVDTDQGIDEGLQTVNLAENKKNSATEVMIASVAELTKKSALQVVEVYDDQGINFISVDTIAYFDVHDKTYRAHTAGKAYKIRKTIVELEQELDSRLFFRTSRSVIVNTSFISNYSYWEYDKFIIRLSGSSEEFVMQRKRLKALKECLLNRCL